MPPKQLCGNSGRIRPGHRTSVKNRFLKAGIDRTLMYPDAFFDKAKITFTWHKAGVGDIDNFAIGMKAFVDGLRRGGMFPDDDYTHVTYGEHSFVRCKRVDTKTVILIEAV